MALKEEVLGQFLGDETFPIEWTSETEKLLFWVYDDLHCPKPLSPMYEDIGGWWLSCDHMFRRFGTPFATDWIYKNINGYLYTAAIPAETGLVVDTQEYDYRTNPIVPEDDDVRGQDRRLPGRGAAGLRQQLHPLVAHALRARDAAQLRLHRGHARPEGRAEPGRRGGPSRGRHRHARPPLEDPLDAELRAAQRDAQPQGGHGEDARQGRRGPPGPAPELRRRPELGQDPGPLGDEGGGQGRRRAQSALRRTRPPPEIVPALQASERGRRFIDERVVPVPEGVRLARRLEPRVHLPVLPRGHEPGHPARPRPVRLGLRLPVQGGRAQGRHRGRRRGRSSRASRARRSRRCAPPTRSTSRWRRSRPDHHFYIDQGANAHVRLVLIALGEKLVEMGVLDRPTTSSCSATTSCASSSATPIRQTVAPSWRPPEPSAPRPRSIRPRDWVGTVTETQLAFPYLNLWGFPDKFHRSAGEGAATRSPASPARRASSRASRAS